MIKQDKSSSRDRIGDKSSKLLDSQKFVDTADDIQLSQNQKESAGAPVPLFRRRFVIKSKEQFLQEKKQRETDLKMVESPKIIR